MQGEVVVLDFWARSCPPCLPLHEALVQMAPTWEARGVRILSILTAEDPVGLQQFFAQHGGNPPFPVLLDSTGMALERFGSAGLPTVVVVDHYGRIALARLGSNRAISDLPSLFPTLLAARAR
jgi:thiol-disulfide isomerase/thioredoxin